MRANRAESRLKVGSVIAGAVFGAGMGIFAKLGGADWVATVVGALVAGIVFGMAMDWWATGYLARTKAGEGLLPPDKLKSARQAASRGPVPSDPEIRAVAARIAHGRLAEYAGTTHWLTIGVMTLLTAGFVVRAFTDSLLALLPAVLFASLLFRQLYMPGQLRRRISVLSAEGEN